ncbi:hypothetical protein Q2T40_01385 [Winogradskyella maritima]|nr:hypothetical protein [Winogradskyella maritima]
MDGRYGYLRLKTAVLAYEIPRSVTEKLKISSLRFHLTGQNILTFSKLDFIDPELGYDDRETAYPVSKSLAFGIDVSF